MSYSSRPLASHSKQGSTTGNPILQARIEEKKAELENLKQLRDLSAGLAGQMQMLEEKLSTLSDGTEGMPVDLRSGSAVLTIIAVATVLSNWNNVLHAITMASSTFFKPIRIITA